MCLWQAAQDGALSSARHGADRQGGTRACSARRAAGLAGPAGVRGGAWGACGLCTWRGARHGTRPAQGVQLVHAAGSAAGVRGGAGIRVCMIMFR